MDKPTKKRNNSTVTKKSSSNLTPQKKKIPVKKTNSKKVIKNEEVILKSKKINNNEKLGKTNSNIKIKKISNKSIEQNIPKKKSKKKIILFTFIILSILIITLIYLLLKLPQFNITSIIVNGNNKILQEEILIKSGINIGDNIVKSVFKINKKAISDTPYIASVNTKIKFPSNLVIEVHERISMYFAYDKEKNIYYKLDKEGVILEVCDKIELKTDELLVYGITFDDEVKLGSKINEIDYSKILVYTEIEEACSKVFEGRKITKVNFENSLTKIHLDDKLEVILPNNTNLTYNLNFLKEILKNEGEVKASIDMTKDNPTLIKF